MNTDNYKTVSGVTIPTADRIAIEKEANRRLLTKVTVIGGLVIGGFILGVRFERGGYRLPITKNF